MPDSPRPTEPEHLLCETCVKEIPYSVAFTYEGPDYILHFCGVECFGNWHQRVDAVGSNRREAR